MNRNKISDFLIKISTKVFLGRGKRILSILPKRKVKKTPDALRWGIIGLGNMAETFGRAIDNSQENIIYAVASRNLEKAQKFSALHDNCKCYGSYESMLDDESLKLDVIYIATPAKCHYEHIKMCLERHKNVLCEKPITTSTKDLEDLRKLAKANDCFLMEGMWMKCLPTFNKADSWIREGKIGNPELIKIDFNKREIVDTRRSIFNASEGGGVMNDYGVYAISFMTKYLSGCPSKVSSYNRISKLNIDTDWSIVAEGNNIKAFVNISSDFGSISKAAIIGEHGTIEWESQFNRTTTVTLYDSIGKKVDAFTASYRSQGFEHELNEVHQCIIAGKKESDIVPLQSSLDCLAAVEMIRSTNK